MTPGGGPAESSAVNTIRCLSEELTGAVQAYLVADKTLQLKTRMANVGRMLSSAPPTFEQDAKTARALQRDARQRTAAGKAARTIILKVVAALPSGHGVVEGWLYELSAYLERSDGVKAVWPKLQAALELLPEMASEAPTGGKWSRPKGTGVAAALIMNQKYSELSANEIAHAVGVRPSTLSRSKLFQRMRKAQIAEEPSAGYVVRDKSKLKAKRTIEYIDPDHDVNKRPRHEP